MARSWIPSRRIREKGLLAAVLLSLSLLGFLTGAFVVRFELWPAAILHRWFMAARALKHEMVPIDRQGPYFYRPARNERTGVVHHDPTRAFDGLTLFTSGHAPEVLLIDMSGAVVKRWQVPFSSLWNDPPHIDGAPASDAMVGIRKAHLFGDGRLLLSFSAAGATPWGYGLAEVDRDSRVRWTYADRVHHDLAVRADGTIYTLSHAVITAPSLDVAGGHDAPFIEDYVLVLSPKGELLARAAISEAFRRSHYAQMLTAFDANLEGDRWHANAVEPVTAALAARLDGVEPGQALVSMRRVDCLAIIDVAREVVVWAALGPWRAQHDPDILTDGTILLFDNLGNLGPGGPSRVVEIDPTTLAVTWQYEGTVSDPLDTAGRGSQHRLPNDNTLITESFAGRLIEITRNGDVVWDYRSPFRAGPGDRLVSILHGAERFDRSQLSFLTAPTPKLDEADR